MPSQVHAPGFESVQKRSHNPGTMPNYDLSDLQASNCSQSILLVRTLCFFDGVSLGVIRTRMSLILLQDEQCFAVALTPQPRNRLGIAFRPAIAWYQDN